MRIDAHQHFWKYRAADYAWIDERMEVLRRDFLPADLADLLAAHALDGSVAVQARQDVEETRWLLELARRHDFIRGVVGWVDLRAPDVAGRLEELSEDRLLRGVRHVVQDEPDDAFLLGDDFCSGVSQLARFGLTYDILVFPHQLPAAVRFVERFPGQPFVLDHIAKPRIHLGEATATGAFADWEARLRELAAHAHVLCKVSGLVTEAPWHGWKPDDIRPYLDVVFDAFGVERLMFGSDWPVCLLAARDYSDVVDLVAGYSEDLTDNQRAGLFGLNAARFYGLEAS